MRPSRVPVVFAACSVLALNALLTAPLKADDFFFKPKDRIVFLGDSITEQYGYSSLIEYYLITRFPNWDLTFLNAGIGGDTAWGGNSRAERDVLSEKPTAVTINFGMNDGGYRGPDANIQTNYINNQTALVKKLTEAKVRVALLSTSPVEGRKRADGETYNQTLENFCEALKDVAAKNGATHYDQFHQALAVLKKMTADNAPFNCFPDSVHTNANGALLMAHSILTAMRAPALVSGATVDASGKVVTSDHCKLTEVAAAGGKLAFTRLDEALPIVVPAEQKALLPYLDNLSALNAYDLKVTGLQAEKYDLSVDGQRVATLTSAELAKGVNLAAYDLGPISAQSSQVWQALNEKNNLLHWRFRNIRMSWVTPPLLSQEEADQFAMLREKELAIVDKVLEARRLRIYELVQPKAHKFELSPTG